MRGQRTHREVVDVDRAGIREFFRQREARVESAEPLTSVLYQDHHPQLARERDLQEKARLAPIIGAGAGDHVLDVACGIGRWASRMLDLGASYTGIDFAEGLLAAAQRAEPRGDFRNLDISELTADRVSALRPTRVLIMGALIYLNDTEVRTLSAALASGLPYAARLLLREPTGLDGRLTLDSIESAELGTRYSAIYRTRGELLDIFGGPLDDAGLILTEDDDLFPAALNNRNETRQRYYVWERGL